MRKKTVALEGVCDVLKKIERRGGDKRRERGCAVLQLNAKKAKDDILGEQKAKKGGDLQ